MQEHNESTDTTQCHLWIPIKSLGSGMSSDKDRKAPFVAACDSEVNRIKESAKIKRSVLTGKTKHTKLFNRRKPIRLIDLNSGKFHCKLMGEVYRSSVTWDPRKAKRITASQSKQLAN